MTLFWSQIKFRKGWSGVRSFLIWVEKHPIKHLMPIFWYLTLFNATSRFWAMRQHHWDVVPVSHPQCNRVRENPSIVGHFPSVPTDCKALFHWSVFFSHTDWLSSVLITFTDTHRRTCTNTLSGSLEEKVRSFTFLYKYDTHTSVGPPLKLLSVCCLSER